MPSLVGKALSSYELIELAGQGGMAAVYRGYDRARNMWVAVKVLAPALAEDRTFVRRFEREAQLLADLKHPSIVPILEFGQADGYLFLVMPFYQEGSLAKAMRHAPIQPLEGGRILSQISGALDYAHQKGVVHRDVKPSNVLLEGDAAHLADFGLAQIGDASISLTGSALLGTPAYVSPEAAAGGEVEAASDQYALGVLIFELTVGRLPFEADTPIAAILKVLHEPFPRPRDLNPKIPDGIERVILKATARDPKERFASVADMNRAFQGALHYALNPSLPPPPRVDVPPSARTDPAAGARLTQPLPTPAPRRKRRSLALLIPLLVLLAFACPIGASAVMDLLRAVSNPAESSGLTSTPPAAEQMTAAAATIEVLSTAIAASHAELSGPDAINTAVALTLAVMNPSATDATSAGPFATQTIFPDASATGPLAGAGASGTPTRTPSRTATPSRTPTRTPTTSGTPGGTPTAIASGTLSASATSSDTDTPVPSVTVVPSDTSVPTEPPAEVDCEQYGLDNWVRIFSRIRVDISNNGASTVKIEGIDLDWPASNSALDVVRLRGNDIWDDGDGNPPTSINSDWFGNRNVGAGNSDELEFDFEDPAAVSGYSLDITLDNGCFVSGSE